jgi:hypothetical protein
MEMNRDSAMVLAQNPQIYVGRSPVRVELLWPAKGGL